jgi:AcrR family transcriptional regulator
MTSPTKTGTASEVSPKEARILDAALDLFVERGFHGTTMPELARRAKVAAGTIYLYFPGKEELVNALLAHLRRGLVRSLEERVRPEDTVRAQFEAIWDVFATYVVENPRAVAFCELHHHAAYVRPETQAAWQPAVELLDAHFREGRRRKVYRDLPPAALRAVVAGVQLGANKLARTGELSLTRPMLERLRECAWAAIVREGVR